MDNGVTIINLTRQIRTCCERAAELVQAEAITRERSKDVADLYEDMFRDEVKHLQQLAIELTRQVEPGTTHGDDSVFQPGELEDKLEDAEVEEPGGKGVASNGP